MLEIASRLHGVRDGRCFSKTSATTRAFGDIVLEDFGVPAGGLPYRDFVDQGLKDQITSLRVYPGACLTVYEHWNPESAKHGKSLTFSGGANGKPDWLLTDNARLPTR